jgi:hypothetical protein
MSTDIKSSPTATNVAVIPREKAESKSAPKLPAQHGIYEDVEARIGNQPLAEESDESQGGMPPNGTFSLWQMLMAIMKYEKNNLDNNAKMQKNYAENLGGANGIFAKLYDVGCAVGYHDAESMRDDAYGKFAQAGVAGGSLVAAGAKWGISTRPEVNAGQAGLDDNTAMEKMMNKSGAGIKLGEAPKPTPITSEADQVEVDKRISGWADGSRSVDNFKGADAEDARLNKLAAEHAANDNKVKIQKKIDKAKTSNQNRISQADTKFNTFQQLNSTVTQGLQNVAGGGASMYAADAAEKKAESNAQQTVISQVQQGVSTSENKAEQNAQDALQQANQWATGFASAASSQVHG